MIGTRHRKTRELLRAVVKITSSKLNRGEKKLSNKWGLSYFIGFPSPFLKFYPLLHGRQTLCDFKNRSVHLPASQQLVATLLSNREYDWRTDEQDRSPVEQSWTEPPPCTEEPTQRRFDSSLDSTLYIYTRLSQRTDEWRGPPYNNIPWGGKRNTCLVLLSKQPIASLRSSRSTTSAPSYERKFELQLWRENATFIISGRTFLLFTSPFYSHSDDSLTFFSNTL